MTGGEFVNRMAAYWPPAAPKFFASTVEIMRWGAAKTLAPSRWLPARPSQIINRNIGGTDFNTGDFWLISESGGRR